VKSDGSVACWGDNTSGAAKAPAGTFVAVSAGGSFTCGVKVDGNVVCWGNSEYGQTTPPAM
jgi:alpha-tubulin suppressor-like RCC1 family protein